MIKRKSHIPFIETIADFFKIYGLGSPLHSEIMCMRLEDQPDEKLMHMPLSRVNFYRVILFTHANLHFYKGEEKIRTPDNCLCFSYPGKLESWTRTERIYGYVVYFTASFAGLDSTSKLFDEEYPYFNFDSEQMVSLTTDETQELSRCAEEMIREIYSEAEDKLEIVRKLLHVYLHKIKRLYNRKINIQPNEVKASKVLFNKFRKAIDDHLHHLAETGKGHHTTVSEIAGRLAVSANYLNDIVKKQTGKAASAHIQEKLLLEAKSYLIHTDLQVAEIANRLGYDNASYFNRFFKRTSGLTPVEYRKAHK